MDQSFPSKEKLKSATLISQLFAEGDSVSKYPIRLVFTKLEDEVKIKARVSVSKRSFKKAVARKYEILGSVGRDLRFSDDVKRVMEYDKATTQSNFIDKNLAES